MDVWDMYVSISGTLEVFRIKSTYSAPDCYILRRPRNGGACLYWKEYVMTRNKETTGFLEEIFDEVDAMADSALREAEEFTSDLIGGKKISGDNIKTTSKVAEDSSREFSSCDLVSSLSKKKIEWQRYVKLKREADLAHKSAEDAYKKYCNIK